MLLDQLELEGFRGFGESFTVSLSGPLTVLVGENGTGKSAVIDAIRVLLQADEFGRVPLTEGDFHKPFEPKAKQSDSLRIHAHFSDLTDTEQIAFLPWTNADNTASLTLTAERPAGNGRRLKRTLWGGASSSSMFEWELMESIDCVYLPPLRDAEARLREGRGSRLAKLLRNLNRKELRDARKAEPQERVPLEQELDRLHTKVAGDESSAPSVANKQIEDRLREAVGRFLSQRTSVQFSELDFERIVENLRLLFHPPSGSAPPPDAFRSLEYNSLGYNNLLYLATVLAELAELANDEPSANPEDVRYLRLLLIEEPEAHLHPQLQVRLLTYLQEQAIKEHFQVIVTTHSPVLASAVSTDAIVHMSESADGPCAVRVAKCGLSPASSAFIRRWLDATKSTLFFAKGVILVEGISEAILLPELAQRVLATYNHSKQRPEDRAPDTLVDARVSIVNMNGVYFSHFMQLFAELGQDEHEHLATRCAGMADRDPDIPKPTPCKPGTPKRDTDELSAKVKDSPNARLYVSPLKTLEYDLAMADGNRALMREVAGEPNAENPSIQDDDERAEAASALAARIGRIGKGLYAQQLSDTLRAEDRNYSPVFCIPDYIRSAVLWAVGADV